MPFTPYRYRYQFLNERQDTIDIYIVPQGSIEALTDVWLPNGSVNIAGSSTIEAEFESGVPVGMPTGAVLSLSIRQDLLITAVSRGYAAEVPGLLTTITYPGSGTAWLDVGSGETALGRLGNLIRITSTGPSWGGGTRVLFEGIQDPLDEVPIAPIGSGSGGASTITITARHIWQSLGTLIPIEALARRCLNVLTPQNTALNERMDVPAYWKQAGETILLNRLVVTGYNTGTSFYRFRDVMVELATLIDEHYKNLRRDATVDFSFESESGIYPTPLDYAEFFRWTGFADGARSIAIAPGSSGVGSALWIPGRVNDSASAGGSTATVTGTGGVLANSGTSGSWYQADSIFDVMNRLVSSGGAKGTLFFGHGPSGFDSSRGLTLYFGKILDRAEPIGRGQVWEIEERDLGPGAPEVVLRKGLVLNVEAGYPEGIEGPINSDKAGEEKRTESDTGGNIDFVLHNQPRTDLREDAEKWPKVNTYSYAANARNIIIDRPPFDAAVFYMAWASDGQTPAGTITGSAGSPVPVQVHPAVNFDLGPYTWTPDDPDVPLEDEAGGPVSDSIAAVMALRRGARRNNWGLNLASAIVNAFGRASQWGIEGRSVPYELSNLETLGHWFEFQRNGVTLGAQLWTGEHAAYSSLPTASFTVKVSIDINTGRTETAFIAAERTP